MGSSSSWASPSSWISPMERGARGDRATFRRRAQASGSEYDSSATSCRKKGGPMPGDTELFEIMHTMRAMRRLKPDPVPDELIRKILQAGACAPNGGNTQRWRFLVIKDAKIKQGVQVYYKRAFDEVVGPRYLNSAPPPGVTRERYNRQHAAVEYLTNHFHEAPVWLVACLEEATAVPTRGSGASLYPAVQSRPGRWWCPGVRARLPAAVLNRGALAARHKARSVNLRRANVRRATNRDNSVSTKSRQDPRGFAVALPPLVIVSVKRTRSP